MATPAKAKPAADVAGEKTRGLTPKQEAFALAYVETSNASEAYRRAYDAERMKPAVIAVKACELLANGNVAVRVSEIQAEAVKRNAVTVDDLLRELEEARAAASGGEKPQAAAMVAATMGKAKLLGFLTEKVEHSGPDGGPIPTTPTVIELVAPNVQGKD